MTTIVTSTGREISLVYPKPGDITLADISHSLGQINRFTGHARRPYSVAEHSLLVCDIAERLLHLSVDGLLAALMHDAHEAYVNDLSTPVKGLLDGTWHHLEERMERNVRSAFALHVPTHVYSEMIKQCDLIALATERAQLLPKSATPWPCLINIQPAEWVDLMDAGRCAMTWSDWAAAFRDKVDELDFGRNAKRFAVLQP